MIDIDRLGPKPSQGLISMGEEGSRSRESPRPHHPSLTLQHLSVDGKLHVGRDHVLFFFVSVVPNMILTHQFLSRCQLHKTMWVYMCI